VHELAHDLNERVLFPDFGITVRTENQYVRFVDVPSNEKEQLQARCIGPLQIVKEQDEWGSFAEHTQKTEKTAEYADLIVLNLFGRRGAHDVGNYVCQLGPMIDWDLPPIGTGQCGKCFAEREEWFRLVLFETATRQYLQPSRTRVPQHLTDEARLPHTRFAADKYNATCVCREVDRSLQPRQFGLPADQFPAAGGRSRRGAARSRSAAGKQVGAFCCIQLERVSQSANGFTKWGLARAAFEIGDASPAQPGPFRERFL
jgi:hypothetical protein